MHRDTRLIFPDNIEVPIKISELTPEQKQLIDAHVELVRHMIELDKLFLSHKFNVDELRSQFSIYPNGTVKHRYKKLDEKQTYIAINSLTNSLISSARVLTGSIEVLTASAMSKTDAQDFKQTYVSKIFDECFSYRFLDQIRNYSQHGHLPVSTSGNRIYFDLQEILDMPHITIRKKLVDEAIEISEDILMRFNNNPRISFLYTVAEYHLRVVQIYNDYLQSIKPIIKDSVLKITRLLQNDPSLTYPKDDPHFPSLLFYDYTDGYYHCFNPDDNILGLYSQLKKEARQVLMAEREAFDKIMRAPNNLY